LPVIFPCDIIDSLKDKIREEALKVEPKPTKGLFRLPIDRVFGDIFRLCYRLVVYDLALLQPGDTSHGCKGVFLSSIPCTPALAG